MPFEPHGYGGNDHLIAAHELTANLHREGRLPDEGPRAELAQDFLRVATLLDRSGIGLKDAWQGENTTAQAQAILQRAFDAINADLQGIEHYDWENDTQILTLLRWIHPPGRWFRHPW